MSDDDLCEMVSIATLGYPCDRYGCIFPVDDSAGECYFNEGAKRYQGRKIGVYDRFK